LITLVKNIANKLRNILFPTKRIIDKHGFEYTVKELVGMHENSIKSTEWYGKLLSDEILQFKKSDTIFILGSGPSINDITNKKWEYIKLHDSIGFNYWFIHDFVPSMYVFQKFNERMLNIFNDKYDFYKETPFIIRGSKFAKEGVNNLTGNKNFELLRNNPVYYLREYPVHSRCSIKPNLLINYFEALGLMPHGKISNFIPKLRGTLGLLIVLSYQMGYKKIVLCGMDMHSSDHFWDYEPYIKVKEKYNLPDKGKANINTFTDKNRSPNTVPVYVKALRDWMYEKSNVEISIVNEKTLLYPDIPVFNMNH